MASDRTKKTITTMLIIIMVFMFAFPAYTAGPPPATGDLYIHKYVGAEEDADNDGTELDTSDWAAVPVNNIVFDLYRVGAAVTHSPEWPEFPQVGAYSIVDDELVVTIAGSTAGVYDLTSIGSITTGDSGTTPEDGVAIAEDLAQGIYLVAENSVASRLLGVEGPGGVPMSIIASIAPFLVAVPMTKVDGTGWLEEVHVYPKNEEMSIKKTVDIEGDTIDAIVVGDTVTYTLIATLPGDIATGKSAEITDELDTALTYVGGSVEVTTMTAVTLVEVTDGVGDYTVDYVANKLTVSFTEEGREKLDGISTVIVTFDCLVNNGILSYVDFTIGNIAMIEFMNDSDVIFISETEEEVDIHTAAIQVIKVDENNAALTGAEFRIATSSANAAAGNFIRQNPTTKDLVDYDPSPSSDWETLGATNDYKGTVAANTTTFSGLKDVIEDVYQTYYIVEIKAPEGYNLLTSAKEVTFTGEEDNYTLEATVKNSTGFILPRTGGIDMIIWTVSGIMLLGAAAIIFATRKKQLHQ